MSAERPDIPLVDLRAAYRPIRDEVLREIDAAFSGMQLFLGPNVQAFEREFADYCELPHGIGVSSGTDALVLALRACGVGRGDEVILPPLTFFATVAAVLHVGAIPVFADVTPDTLTIDPERVREAVTERTRAILPVHIYGQPDDMSPLLEIASERELRLIEDAAQAHGARDHGRRCGTLGDAAAFSFYFTKNLGAFGEAGFVATRNAEIARSVRLLRDHGHADKRTHETVGYNARLDEVQAAILRIRLRGLERDNARRRAIAAFYSRRFAESPARPIPVRPTCESVHHLYPVRVADREDLAAWLAARGIGTGVHYAVPVHQQRALDGHVVRAGDLPVAEKACRELLSIPIYPELTDEQAERVAEAVLAWTRSATARKAAS